MAKPKLALIPATQGSKLYSVLPADGVGDFDFSRNSAATRINKDGLIETVASGVSRLNYPLIDGVVNGCPSHLLEPSRLQKIQYSEDFSQSAWTTLASGETIVSNSVISPDGTLNADTLEGDGTATNVHLRNDITLSTSVDYTFSIFAKKGTNDFLAISAEGFSGATNTLLIFDLNNSIVTNGTGNIENYGNGWLRCSFTIAISTDGTGRFLVYTAYNGTTRGFPTSSDANGQNIYIYGAMLEQGSYPTSYIPNYGIALGVTRSAETANGAGDASTFNDSEGVLMAEISALANDGTNRMISLSNGVSTISNATLYFIPYANQIRYIYEVSSAQQCSIIANVNVLLSNKCSAVYKLNRFELWVNGFKVGEETNGIINPEGTFTKLSFLRGASQLPFYGSAKQLQYFDSALNDSDLETITSWTSFTDMANGQLYSIK